MTEKIHSDSYYYDRLGTPKYMSRELFLSKFDVKAADFWALGVTLIEIFYTKIMRSDEIQIIVYKLIMVICDGGCFFTVGFGKVFF